MGRPGAPFCAPHAYDLGRGWRPLELCGAVALAGERVLAARPVCRGTDWEGRSRPGAQYRSQGPSGFLPGSGRREGFVGAGPWKV